MIEIQKLVAACLILVRGKADAGGLTISVEAPTAVPEIVGDERLLKQTCSTCCPTRSVHAQGRRDPDPIKATRAGIEIAVIDSGIGMSERSGEGRQAVRPARELAGPQIRRHRLGLSIAKAFCELHGGRLEIVSAPGKGTTATIHLPASRIAATPTSASPPNRDPLKKTAPSANGRRCRFCYSADSG